MTLTDLMYTIKDLCISIQEALSQLIIVVGDLVETDATMLRLHGYEVEDIQIVNESIQALDQNLIALDKSMEFLITELSKLGSYITGIFAVVIFAFVLLILYIGFKYKDRIADLIFKKVG